jgi:hypothetical protein
MRMRFLKLLRMNRSLLQHAREIIEALQIEEALAVLLHVRLLTWRTLLVRGLMIFLLCRAGAFAKMNNVLLFARGVRCAGNDVTMSEDGTGRRHQGSPVFLVEKRWRAVLTG